MRTRVRRHLICPSKHRTNDGACVRQELDFTTAWHRMQRRTWEIKRSTPITCLIWFNLVWLLCFFFRIWNDSFVSPPPVDNHLVDLIRFLNIRYQLIITELVDLALNLTIGSIRFQKTFIVVVVVLVIAYYHCYYLCCYYWLIDFAVDVFHQ